MASGLPLYHRLWQGDRLQVGRCSVWNPGQDQSPLLRSWLLKASLEWHNPTYNNKYSCVERSCWKCVSMCYMCFQPFRSGQSGKHMITSSCWRNILLFCRVIKTDSARFVNQASPWPWGSISKGYRVQCITKEAFCSDSSSVGRPCYEKRAAVIAVWSGIVTSLS